MAAKDQTLITGRTAYGWDGTNAYPIKAYADGRLNIRPMDESFFIHPFARGNLTATGAQYSASADTATVNTNVNIEVVTITTFPAGNFREIELGLTCGINAVSNANTVLKYTWQGRNSGTTWVDLMTQTANTPGLTEIEKTFSGYKTAVTNFNSTPLQLRLIVEANITNEGRARTKNSSYVRGVIESV